LGSYCGIHSRITPARPIDMAPNAPAEDTVDIHFYTIALFFLPPCPEGSFQITYSEAPNTIAEVTSSALMNRSIEV